MEEGIEGEKGRGMEKMGCEGEGEIKTPSYLDVSNSWA